jgi:hypothetical protein
MYIYACTPVQLDGGRIANSFVFVGKEKDLCLFCVQRKH